MINVTDNAVRRLHVLLKDKADARRRVACADRERRCSGLHYEMALDQKNRTNAVVERDGVKFYVDTESWIFAGRDFGFSRRIDRGGLSHCESECGTHLRMRFVL